jgi:hypothetical protein
MEPRLELITDSILANLSMRYNLIPGDFTTFVEGERILLLIKPFPQVGFHRLSGPAIVPVLEPRAKHSKEWIVLENRFYYGFT